ncbi:hypothetical protein Tco_1311736 [Tanacetum coccineum]
MIRAAEKAKCVLSRPPKVIRVIQGKRSMNNNDDRGYKEHDVDEDEDEDDLEEDSERELETESESSWISSIFPQAEHRLCARHIYANWYSDFRAEKLRVAFYLVAKCANEAQMQQRLDETNNIKDGNNSTEAWNFMLIGARSKPIISMNESIREYLMERRIQKLYDQEVNKSDEPYDGKIDNMKGDNDGITSSHDYADVSTDTPPTATTHSEEVVTQSQSRHGNNSSDGLGNSGVSPKGDYATLYDDDY